MQLKDDERDGRDKPHAPLSLVTCVPFAQAKRVVAVKKHCLQSRRFSQMGLGIRTVGSQSGQALLVIAREWQCRQRLALP
jgi:hypothetical protein